jgi:uncharacterized protein with GYD domain
MLFMISMKFTEQGIRTIKEVPKRVQGARDLAKKLGVEIKQVYLTSGENDFVPSWKRQTATTSPNSRLRSARWQCPHPHREGLAGS